MSEPSRSNTNQCTGTRRDGSRCGAPVAGPAGLCFTHDPAKADERSAARRRGGRNRASVVRLRGLVPPRLVPIFDKLEAALDEVHTGYLDPKRATAMAS